MEELPFNPIQRSDKVEQLVMQGDKRRYYRFRYAKFYGGIVTCIRRSKFDPSRRSKFDPLDD